jgi:hypothetical protein
MCGVWRGYDIAGVGGGEFALQLVLHQRVAPPYWRSDTHTHTQRIGYSRDGRGYAPTKFHNLLLDPLLA